MRTRAAGGADDGWCTAVRTTDCAGGHPDVAPSAPLRRPRGREHSLSQGYAPAQPPVSDRPTSTLAVLGLVVSVVFWPAGLILSVLGLRDTRADRRTGRGLAIAGLVISLLAAVVSILVLLVTVVLAGATVGAVNDTVEGIEAEQDAALTDVQVTACGPGDLGQSATLTITNSDDEPRTCTVTVSADDASGARLGELNAFSNAIAPGQSATVDAVCSVTDPSLVTECTLADVSRS